jgi:hypothetical protein
MLTFKKIIKLFFIVLLIQLINGYLFNYLNLNFFKLEHKVFDERPHEELILFMVVIGPIIETLFFQLFLYRLLNRLKIKNDLISVILMAFVFSQLHWYHWLYVVATFVNGLFLNYFYINSYKMKNERIAVLLTIVLHSTYNLYGVLFVY